MLLESLLVGDVSKETILFVWRSEQCAKHYIESFIAMTPEAINHSAVLY